MGHDLRFPDETDAAFLARVIRTARVASVLVASCLANHEVQAALQTGELKERDLRSCPIVRVDWEQAIGIGRAGEVLSACKNKNWGDGPYILPLEPNDQVGGCRIGYVYKPSSLYNMRFEQRNRLKQMLGKQFRKLVGTAKYHTKTIFMQYLTIDEANAIRRRIHVEPGIFWRAAKGKVLLDLPKRDRQRELFPAE